jgi:hypothetical protein
MRFKELLIGHKCYEIFGVIRMDALLKTSLMGGYAHGDGVLLSRLALLGRFSQIKENLFFTRTHSGQSMAMIGDYRKYAAWFNPIHKKRFVFPYWRMHIEFLWSIIKYPLNSVERKKCFKHLAMIIYSKRRELLEDILYYIRQISFIYNFYKKLKTYNFAYKNKKHYNR